MKKIFALILLCAPLILSGCNSGPFAYIKEEQFLKYLENTYGADHGFVVTKHLEQNYFEWGHGYVYFSADDLDGKSFCVDGYFYYNKPCFEDDYVEVKYEDELLAYYASLFSGILNSGDFALTVDARCDKGYSFPLVDFEEFLTLVSNQRVDIAIHHYVALDPDSPYFVHRADGEERTDADFEESKKGMERYISDNFDISELERKVADIIESNGLTVNCVELVIDEPNDNYNYYAGCYRAITLYENTNERN